MTLKTVAELAHDPSQVVSEANQIEISVVQQHAVVRCRCRKCIQHMISIVQ